jgi:outer membrane protein OmpA-like peptidoglycan-associated protein
MKNKEKQQAITIIENLYYAYGDYKIDAAGQNILDKVITVLNSNKNLNIELSSHTDARGNDAYNMRLSQGRAQSCVDYMLSKGIKKDKIHAKGYGETKPIIPEEEINKMVPKSEEFELAHQKNRRTAFRVVGESKINIINKTQ